MTGILLSLLYLAIAGTFGVAVVRRATGRVFGRLEQVAYGAPLGIMLGSFALLAIGLAAGLSVASVGIVGVACLAGAAALTPAFWRRRDLPAMVRSAPANWSLRRAAGALRCRIGLFPLIVLTGLIALWAAFYLTMTFERDGALWASQIHIWSDISLHLGQVNAFAYGDNFPPQNPFVAGEPLVYHYLIALTTAALVKLGMEPLAAIRLHDLILTCLVTLAIFAFARRLMRSATAAALTVLLFFLGSGLGWLVTAAEINRSNDLVGTLLNRAWDYGAVGQAGMRWEPLFLVAVAPTRGTLYGLALGVLCLALLFEAVRRREQRLFLFAAVVAGLLPLAHTGTLLALALVTPFLVVLFPARYWLSFFAVWIAITVPQFYLEGGLNGGASRIQRDFGWMADDKNVVWFWLTNLGLFVPLLLLSLFDQASTTATARRFLWAFMPIFLIANVVSFSTIGPWDNLKVLIYWFLAVCMLVAALICRTWSEHRTLLVRTLLAGCVASMLLSGLLMHLHVARGRNALMVFSPGEIAVARQMREIMAPDAIVASGLQHNPVITTLTGRPTLLFFTPYVRSWGNDPTQRERDLRTIYAFAPGTDELLRKYNVSYLLIGPNERNGLNANVEAFRRHFPVVASAEGNEVFDVRRPIDATDPAPAVSAIPAYPARNEGECVVAISGGTPYWLEGGYRRPIPDDETRRSLGCVAVWPWQDQEIERIPEGRPVPPAE